MCKEFFDKLSEFDHSASHRGYATEVMQRPGTQQLSISRRQLSYNVTFSGRDADRPHTHNSRYPHRPLDLHQSYTHHTQRPPQLGFVPTPAAATLAHPR